MSDSRDILIDLCICSYKRPEIADLLRQVSSQTGFAPDRLRVIVVDNTEDAMMRVGIIEAGSTYNLNLRYVHAPANNISIARNACLDHAKAPWVAFLDDDETPTPDWLGILWREAVAGQWDAVLGPVKALYPPQAPSWLARGDFHSTAPVWVQGRIRTAYTGNVLFRREMVERFRLRFRKELGKSGGEDEDFFYRLFDAGGRIGFAADAVVYETVPPERARFTWLMRRNFRAGQSHGARLNQRGGRFRDIIIASAKAGWCCAGAALCAAHAIRRNRFLTRAALHAGVVARLMRLKQIELY
ncbi:MAG TPA: glycosyltransferase family 2 protein [Rhizomicrobium sp.]|nr:glycosyltransferase family 2 protein [Rhizomicrobium sp.]